MVTVAMRNAFAKAKKWQHETPRSFTWTSLLGIHQSSVASLRALAPCRLSFDRTALLRGRQRPGACELDARCAEVAGRVRDVDPAPNCGGDQTGAGAPAGRGRPVAPITVSNGERTFWWFGRNPRLIRTTRTSPTPRATFGTLAACVVVTSTVGHFETKKPCRVKVLCRLLRPWQRKRGPSARHSSRHYLRDGYACFRWFAARAQDCSDRVVAEPDMTAIDR